MELLHVSGNPDSWQGAVDVLTGNSINLMNAIKELLKATKVVSATSKSEYNARVCVCVCVCVCAWSCVLCVCLVCDGEAQGSRPQRHAKLC